MNPKLAVRLSPVACLVAILGPSCAGPGTTPEGSGPPALVESAMIWDGAHDKTGDFTFLPTVSEPSDEVRQALHLNDAAYFNAEADPVVTVEEFQVSDADPVGEFVRAIARYTTRDPDVNKRVMLEDDDVVYGNSVAVKHKYFQVKVDIKKYDADLQLKLYPFVYRVSVLVGGRAVGFADIALSKVEVVEGKKKYTLKAVDLKKQLECHEKKLTAEECANDYVVLDEFELPVKFWMNRCAGAATAPLDACHLEAVCTVDGQGQQVLTYPVKTEVCNGADDDCDGSVDEGLTCGQETGDTTTQSIVPNANQDQVLSVTGLPVLIHADTQVTVNGVPTVAPVAVTIGTVTDPTERPSGIPDDVELFSPVLVLGPSGATFAPAIEVTLDVPDGEGEASAWLCDDGGTACEKLVGTYWTDQTVSPAQVKMTVPVSHFSKLAAGRTPCKGKVAGDACTDSDPCTLDPGTCQPDTQGTLVCVSAPVVCAALDACHDVGVCQPRGPTAGTCTNPPKVDGTVCDDGDLCTQADICQAGSCAGSAVVCTASDPCHADGVCDPTTGVCSTRPQADGAPCDDGDSATAGDQCVGGECAGSPTAAACPGSQTFTYTGAAQSFVVPPCATSLTVIATGASGGGESTGTPGQGGRTQATVAVVAGETLLINVGGQGETGGSELGGFNGGAAAAYDPYLWAGGGGGASDVRDGAGGLTDRLVVAGGGGGVGAGTVCDGGRCSSGGNGGGLIGQGGFSNGSGASLERLGTGGTQTAGGIASCGYYGCSEAGGFGAGGAGGGFRGGGGGGGYFGGGGGNDAGGGGGSSYAIPGATGVTHTQGGNTGNGLVTLTWTGSPPNTWESLAPIPGAPTLPYIGGDLSTVVNGRYLYFTQGTTMRLDRYDIAGNTWEPMADIPSPFMYPDPRYKSLAYSGTGDLMYLLIRDNWNAQFHLLAYSLSNDQWQVELAAPGTGGGSGVSLVHVGGSLYATFGNGSTLFARYAIATNSWSALTSLPFGPDCGGGLIDAGDGDLYLLGDNGFARYSPSIDTWTGLPNLGTVYCGGHLAYPDAGDHLYATPGGWGGSAALMRFSISQGAWESVASAPVPFYRGGSLACGGGGRIYGYPGETSTAFLVFNAPD